MPMHFILTLYTTQKCLWHFKYEVPEPSTQQFLVCTGNKITLCIIRGTWWRSCYKPKGCEFNSQWVQCNFSLTESFWPHYSPWVDGVPGVSPGGRGSWCIGLATLPPSCADSLEIVTASTPGNPKDLIRPV
jgi:hypothetical protein